MHHPNDLNNPSLHPRARHIPVHTHCRYYLPSRRISTIIPCIFTFNTSHITLTIYTMHHPERSQQSFSASSRSTYSVHTIVDTICPPEGSRQSFPASSRSTCPTSHSPSILCTIRTISTILLCILALDIFPFIPIVDTICPPEGSRHHSLHLHVQHVPHHTHHLYYAPSRTISTILLCILALDISLFIPIVDTICPPKDLDNHSLHLHVQHVPHHTHHLYYAPSRTISTILLCILALDIFPFIPIVDTICPPEGSRQSFPASSIQHVPHHTHHLYYAPSRTISTILLCILALDISLFIPIVDTICPPEGSRQSFPASSRSARPTSHSPSRLCTIPTISTILLYILTFDISPFIPIVDTMRPLRNFDNRFLCRHVRHVSHHTLPVKGFMCIVHV
ncbi:hypothetical protein Hypma_009857 [Hypsizygus marmoreus]|uniref:Uncharacterized protein n=1 Tax=Hypsizygus marmoreus TaxID=39966 RepID=A0A369JWE5_HYPMA|nr:hypothetical protein Hypma_009857 [Hypsizygus marmoreus]